MRRLLNKFLIFFLIIQPIIDIYILYKPEVVEMFGFSPATIIRVFFFGILFLLLLFNEKIIKNHKWLVVYGILILIYCGLHHYNALNFTSLVPGDFNYSLFSELFYIIRMSMPLGMILISYYCEMKDNALERIITWLVILISGSIVITNILGISLGSYSKVQIEGNIFSWFTNGYEITNYLGLASKSFFNDPNRISALCVLLTSILFYTFIKRPTLKNLLLVIIQFLGMYMLGTKVSTLGFLGVTIASLFIYLFFSLIKKELPFSHFISITFLFIIATGLMIYPVSPAMNRKFVDNQLVNDYNNNVDGKKEIQEDGMITLESELLLKSFLSKEEVDAILEYDKKQKNHNVYIINGQKMLISKDVSDKLLIDFITNNYYDYNINPHFIELSYPYQYDPYFWLSVMKKPLEYRISFRSLERDMLNRVKEINDNKADELLGLTFTRVSNIFDLERDFISHYYTLGIIGFILLISPYLLIILFCGFKMIKDYKKSFNFKNCMFILAISITIFAAFYSGNVLDGLIVTLILGFVYGQLIKNVFSNKKDNKKISVIIPTYNDSDTVIETLESITKQTYKNYEVIIVDDGSTDSTKQIVNKYIEDKNDRFLYLYQKNADQLNAIKKAIKYITGDYIMILHSDDLLPDFNTLKYAIDFFDNNENVDGIISDLLLINENNEDIGIQRTNEFRNSKVTAPTVLLWLGRNIYKDTTIIKKEKFLAEFKNNYLDWNMPFWLNYDEKVELLKIRKVYFPLICYRIHENNYINNILGNLSVLNGELRTATRLLKYYEIPKYKLQYKIYRIMNKLRLNDIYFPIYYNRENNNKAEIVETIISKRVENYNEISYLKAIVKFYYKDNPRSVKIDFSKCDKLFIGSELREFNKLVIENKLPKFYNDFIKEIEKGFNTIIVDDNYYIEAVALLKFFCIYPYVKIECNPEGKSIPKKIHFVWVGGKNKPKAIQRCMKTWSKLEGYEMKEWNEKNFDINSHPFTKKAYESKKWAFVSDYIRAHAIYNEGGVYFDTDIFVIRNIDKLLNNRAFVGYENPDYPFTAVFGAEAKHPFVKEMLDYYDNLDLDFKFEDNNTISVSDLLIEKYNCKKGNVEQVLPTGIKVYKENILCNPSLNSLTVHAFLGSWLEEKSWKSKIHEFLRVRLSNKFLILLYCKLYKEQKRSK